MNTIPLITSKMISSYLQIKETASLKDLSSSNIWQTQGDNAYVTNAMGQLVGFITKDELVNNLNSSQTVGAVMCREIIKLNSQDPVDFGREILETGLFPEIPVVNDQDILVGIVNLESISDQHSLSTSNERSQGL